MKVCELIEQLRHEDPDAEVHFSYNYGDRPRTQVAPKVCRIEAGPVRHSDYHRMPVIVDEEDEKPSDTFAVVLF